MKREANNVAWLEPPTQSPRALTSLPGAVHAAGGAEAEQDGCVLGTGELRTKGVKSLKYCQTRHKRRREALQGWRGLSEREDGRFRRASRTR